MFSSFFESPFSTAVLDLYSSSFLLASPPLFPSFCLSTSDTVLLPEFRPLSRTLLCSASLFRLLIRKNSFSTLNTASSLSLSLSLCLSVCVIFSFLRSHIRHRINNQTEELFFSTDMILRGYFNRKREGQFFTPTSDIKNTIIGVSNIFLIFLHSVCVLRLLLKRLISRLQFGCTDRVVEKKNIYIYIKIAIKIPPQYKISSSSYEGNCIVTHIFVWKEPLFFISKHFLQVCML